MIYRLKPLRTKKLGLIQQNMLNMWKINLIVFINCTNSDQQEPTTKKQYFFEFRLIMLKNAESCLLFVPFFSLRGEKYVWLNW